jgi:predicted GNAT family N-acyltransferase
MQQQLFEVGARVQAGKAILAQPARQAGRAAQVRARCTFTDIAMETHDVGHATVATAYRLNHHLIPELRTVLAIVAHQRTAGLPARNRLAQLGAPFLLAIRTLQAAQVLPDQFIGRVAAQALERGVGIGHRLVGLAGFAHDDAFGRRIQHPAQEFD